METSTPMARRPGWRHWLPTTVSHDRAPAVVPGTVPPRSVSTATNVVEAELIRDGKVVGNVRREVSPDRNTMKMVYVIHRPDGTSVSTLSVFERQ
jgi:hypothetical protein